MPGQVWGLATAHPDGPVFVTSYPGKDLTATIVTAVDRDGAVLWHRDLDGRPRPPRVGPEGTVWHAGAQSLTEVSATGDVLRTVGLGCDDEEFISAFVVLADGFCVAWQPRPPYRVVSRGLLPRVARYETDGRSRWTTSVEVPVLSYPRTVEPARSPLLVSGNRVAVTFAEGSSGIATTHLLDAGTGALVASTPDGPSAEKAIAGPGEFLLGSQGYGAFRTERRDASGAVTGEWPTHVLPLVDRHGGIRGPEFENRLPSRSRFRVLGDDGEGPRLSAYYTSYPALDRDLTTIFWRDGRLLTVDADLRMRELFALPGDERKVMSRILLLDRGRVLYALNSDLFVVDTGLAELDTGPWPCGDGNLRGNPVA
jgi:hypothetical protein